METGRRRGYKELVPPEGSASEGKKLESWVEEPGGEPDPGRSTALIDTTGLQEFSV